MINSGNDWKEWSKFMMEEIKSLHEEHKRMNSILLEKTQSLKEHIRRTEILEDVAIKLSERMTGLEIIQIEEKAVATYKSDRLSQGAKIIGVVIAIITTTIGILSWIKTN